MAIQVMSCSDNSMEFGPSSCTYILSVEWAHNWASHRSPLWKNIVDYHITLNWFTASAWEATMIICVFSWMLILWTCNIMEIWLRARDGDSPVESRRNYDRRDGGSPVESRRNGDRSSNYLMLRNLKLEGVTNIQMSQPILGGWKDRFAEMLTKQLSVSMRSFE